MSAAMSHATPIVFVVDDDVSVASLGRREREVTALVVSGLLNKQVGGELGISEITAHRGKVMRKMMAGSRADLVKMAARLRLAPAPKVRELRS